MEQPKTSGDSQVIVRLPRAVRIALRVCAAEEETSVQQIMNGLIADYLQTRQRLPASARRPAKQSA